MKKVLFITAVLALALFSLSCSSVFAGGSVAPQPGPQIREVRASNGRAHIQFQPGSVVKYVAEYGDKKATLTPDVYTNAWGEGSLDVGLFHSYRSKSTSGGFDELSISTRGQDKDFEVKLDCFLKDGTIITKNIRVIKGLPGVVKVDGNEIIVSLSDYKKE